MGVFGETSEERELRALVDEKSAALKAAELGHDHTRELLVQQGKDLERARSVNTITDIAERALRDAEDSGEVQISAVDTATGIVRERYVGHAEAAIADKIITDQADAIRMKRGPEWDDEIEERLREQFERDGTFDRVERETDAIDIGVIGQRLRDHAEEEREAFNKTPERSSELEHQARQTLEQQGVLEDIRAAKDAEAEKEARDIAYQIGLGEIDHEIAASKADRIAELKAEWRESADGKNYVRYRRTALDKEVRGKSEEEVAEEVDDEILRELLKDRAQRLKEQLEAEKFYADHLDGFTHKGIDMTKIPEGSQVKIELGTLTDAIDTSRGYRSETGRKTVNAQRTLTLTSLGDGRYRLESDSLGNSKNVWEKKAAIPTGMTIHLGREMHETKEGKTKTTLHESLREGVLVYYDDDRDDPAFASTELPVANIRIDGISALKKLEEDSK